MFTWLIEEKLAKAAARDNPVITTVTVAVELANTDFLIQDKDIRDERQRLEIIDAVFDTVRLLAVGEPVCVVCVEGLSRSPTIACTAAALWEQTSFDKQLEKLKSKDTVLDHSPIVPLTKEIFPQLWR